MSKVWGFQLPALVRQPWKRKNAKLRWEKGLDLDPSWWEQVIKQMFSFQIWKNYRVFFAELLYK